MEIDEQLRKLNLDDRAEALIETLTPIRLRWSI